jgi:hypothetical protein
MSDLMLCFEWLRGVLSCSNNNMCRAPAEMKVSDRCAILGCCLDGEEALRSKWCKRCVIDNTDL